MTSRVRVGIAGIGSHVPEKILSNRDLEQLVDTTDE
ncbi:MAG: 3-oxoacyl-ACP synthase, partial [Planctomycetota bacterium]|nr:3-oxoacyl-ACP synthase [Planctomycetota bacterium]